MAGSNTQVILLDGVNISIEDVFNVAYHNTPVSIDPATRNKVDKCRAHFDHLKADGKPIYGVTTGYGDMVMVYVPPEHETELQTNLVLSHCTAVGEMFSVEETRAMMVCRLNALCKGYSGVRMQVLNMLVQFLNNGATPLVPKIGSLGASGDLGTLAHIAATLIGHGYVFYQKEKRRSSDVLRELQMEPITLKAKDGLGLINGTSGMTGVGSLTICEAMRQVRQAEAIAALVLEVLQVSASPYAANGHDLARPHAGQIASASNIRKLTSDSQMMSDHEDLCSAIKQHNDTNGVLSNTGVYLQKAYSLRCVPQVYGAVRDTLQHAKKVLETELNSANDNPLIFEGDDDIFHGGNFHGQPVAFVMDYSTIALTQLGNMAERQLNRLLNKNLNNGMPENLIKGNPGLHCGLVGAQYTATALASENRALATPKSIQIIPAGADNQDVVSMGLTSARYASQVLENNYRVLAIEWIAAGQAVDIQNCQSKLSSAGQITYKLIRKHVPTVEDDRALTEDIETAAHLLRNGALIQAIASSSFVFE